MSPPGVGVLLCLLYTSTAGGYKLKSGSACLGAGKAIANNGGKDFFGGKVAGTPSIGAHQG